MTTAMTALALTPVSSVSVGPVNLASSGTASASVSAVGALPSPRTRTSAVWANGSAYVFGGRTFSPSEGYSSTREIVRFTPGAGSTVVGQLPPTPQFAAGGRYDGRQGTAAIWDGTHAYVFGGYDASGEPLDEIVRFDPSTGQAQVVARLPKATAGAAVAWDGESAYLFGGYVSSQPSAPTPGTPPPGPPAPDPGPPGSPPRLSDQIVRFTPASGSATTLSARLPSPRNHAAAVYDNPFIHVYGGHTGQDASDEILSFAPIDGTFVEFPVKLPSPRHDASAMWLPSRDGLGGVAYLFGGAAASADDNATDEIVAHDPAQGGGAVEVVDRLSFGRAHVSAVASDAAGGYLFGGESGAGNGQLSDRITRFTRPVRYVALGDSYSSGEGLGEESHHPPYLEGGDPTCHRHRFAYPRLFEFNGPTQLDFYACSGARTEHVHADQRQAGQPAELVQALNPEVTDRTDLVTMTIGGNDVGEPDEYGIGGLSDPLGHCYSSRDCDQDAEFVQRLDSNIAAVGEKLRLTLAKVKQVTGPDTAIVVLGYPRAFPTDADPAQLAEEQSCGEFAGGQIVPPFVWDGGTYTVDGDGWTPSEQVFLNAAVDELNSLSSSVASQEGARFVDVTDAFTGHAICDEPENDHCVPEYVDETTQDVCEEGEDWINPLTPDGSLGDPARIRADSFHPNLEGHFAYSGALRTQLHLAVSLIRRGVLRGRVTPVGMPVDMDGGECDQTDGGVSGDPCSTP